MNNEHPTIPVWLPELKELVQAELARLESLQEDQQPDLEGELTALRQSTDGWLTSLANKDLDATVRQALESAWAEAEKRKQEIEHAIRSRQNRDQRAAGVIDEAAILQRLKTLSEVLANYGPTRGNLELSLYIDQIVCYSDRRVVMRTCKLGLLPDVAELLADAEPSKTVQPHTDNGRTGAGNGKQRTGPRRRGRLRTSDLVENGGIDAREIADFVADTNRFADLSDQWFWVDEFHIPVKRAWVEENAEAVLRRQRELEEATGKKPTLKALAGEFKVSRPTIATALDIATGKRLARQERRLEKWNYTMPLDRAQRHEIIRLYDETPLTLKEIGTRCGVHRSTVERILNARDKERGVKRVDGRQRRSRYAPADKE